MKTTPRLLTINFHEGRISPIEMIVIHVTEGSATSVVSWFNNPDAKVSAHYLVTKAGEVIEFVHEEDVAWHAGRVDHPTADLVKARKGKNPNDYSIGIEHEGDGKHELNDAQRAASVELIRDICARHQIPIDRKHIVGHHEVYSLKTCPGAINVDRLVTEAATGQDRPAAPRVVWSAYTNDWLVVTRVVHDTEWYYVRASDIKTEALATVPLSRMERASL